MRQDIVVERLRAELDAARDELGQRVRVERREEGIAPADPDVVAIEAELERYQGQYVGTGETGLLTQTSAWTPRLLFQAASTMSSLEEVVGILQLAQRDRTKCLLKALVVACSIKPDVTTVEVIPYVMELLVQLFKTLA